MQHVKSRRVAVNPSGLWSLGLRFESGRDYSIFQAALISPDIYQKFVVIILSVSFCQRLI